MNDKQLFPSVSHIELIDKCMMKSLFGTNRLLYVNTNGIFSRAKPCVASSCSQIRTIASTTTSSPSTFSPEKMATDKRYQPESNVPEHVLKNVNSDEVHSPGFSIRGKALEGRPAYLDFQATTPTDPRVLDAMLPYMTQYFGNPHSKTHVYGWEAENAVEEAREHVANLIGCSSKEIIFTSGATESNNMAIKGISRFYKARRKHVITTQTEHKCVLDSCRILETEGFEVSYLPVKEDGLLDMDLFRKTLRPDTVLVSVMGVNNEIGVIQPLEEIGKLCRQNKTFLHSDIAQMAGKIPMNVDELNIDVGSISSHKIYGPKGIGALYLRRKPRVKLEPIMNGGGQERGMRSGTLSPALCVGLGKAAQVYQKLYQTI